MLSFLSSVLLICSCSIMFSGEGRTQRDNAPATESGNNKEIDLSLNQEIQALVSKTHTHTHKLMVKAKCYTVACMCLLQTTLPFNVFSKHVYEYEDIIHSDVF